MDEDIQCRIRDIISEIERKSADGIYIYRGEPEMHEGPPYYGKVSSSLWREIMKELSKQGIDIPIINTKFIQTEMLSAVQNYANETTGEGEFEIMGELQHYGGKTNLIDFTTDYLRALFFACNGSPNEDGRVILLQRGDDIDRRYNIKKPQNPINRVIAQKSIFVQPPDGFIGPQDICGKIIIIPKDLKQWILQHLRKYHDISIETIYNDLHGFIKNQNLHQRSYIDFYIGLSHQSRDDYDLAIADYTRAIQLNPSFAEAYNNRGTVYSQKGDYRHAIVDISKAIELNPNFADAYSNRGLFHSLKGDYVRAIVDLDKAMELNPNYATAYNNRGLTYYNQGDLNHAIEDYTKAIELNPNFAEAYNNRGLTYYNQGDLNHAIEDYTKAIELKSDYVEAYNNRGAIYHNQGDLNHAIEDYTKAIELKSDYATAYSNRGDVYRNQGNLDRAIEDINKAIELNPNYATAYNNRGVAHGTKKEYDRAIEDFNKAIELNPNYVKAYYNRGETWLHIGEWEKAKSDLTTVEEKGVNIVNAFRNNYGSIHAFEERYGIQLPADIAEMLTST